MSLKLRMKKKTEQKIKKNIIVYSERAKRALANISVVYFRVKN